MTMQQFLSVKPAVSGFIKIVKINMVVSSATSLVKQELLAMLMPKYTVPIKPEPGRYTPILGTLNLPLIIPMQNCVIHVKHNFFCCIGNHAG